ncbi:MAG: endonuclease [Bacteriovoracaceae bacterium]|nr:endonuclease [Bacteriovoracaceae bacterium]
MKAKLLIALFLSLLVTGAFALSYDQTHSRENIGQAIPDLGFTGYVIEDFSVNKIETIKLALEITHSRTSDLLITLTSPLGDYVVLHNMTVTNSDTLMIIASGGNLLSDFIGQSAIGRWEIQVYDQIRGVVGIINKVHLTVNGGDIDRSVDRPFPTLTGIQCGEKWNEILAEVQYDSFYKGLIGNCGGQLMNKIKSLIKNHKSMSYDSARRIMFSKIDNHGGRVCSVYSDRCLSTKGLPPNRIMNCEHSWPQSKGAVGVAQSDLHHLFPSGSKENSTRSSHPFCEIELSDTATKSVIGKRNGRVCYEPKDGHKGDLARAMFYFALRYDKKVNTFQEQFFRKWNREDRVSFKEVDRNNIIENYQGNRNPFIDHPELVDLISDF